MAAAVTLSGGKEPLTTGTISGTGFANSTAYIVTISDASGWRTYLEVTSSGSGAFTALYVPQIRGSWTVDVRPRTEFQGTTTAAATTTGKTK